MNKRNKKRKRNCQIQKRIATVANIANGGCFHSIRWVKQKQQDEKKLQRSIRENTSKCITRKLTEEERKRYFGE